MSASLPLSLPQFIAIAQAAVPAGVVVRFGTQVGARNADKTMLMSGVRFDEDDYAELGPTYRHEEHYVIPGQICSWANGVDDQQSSLEEARLAEIYAIYNPVAIAVANNPTLNGTVRLAWMRQLSYSPSFDAKGSIGVLSFEVECQQRSTSLS